MPDARQLGAALQSYDGPVMREYNPTWRDRLATALMGDSRATPERANFVSGLVGSRGLGSTGNSVVDFTPAGAVLQGQEAARAGDNKGVALAALGVLPGVGPAERAAMTAERAVEREAPHIIAYHGSPHSFDRFDMSKIGTGEGAQAYGHGLYFADSEDVARSYRDNLAVKNDPREGINNILDNVGFGVQRGDVEAHAAGLGLPNLSEAQLDDIYAALRGRNSDGTISDSGLDALRRLDRTLPPAGKGSMYQVRINADPEHFLDWDKPLSEHPEPVRRKLGWTPEAEFQFHAAQSADDNALLAALEGDGSGYTPSKVPVPAGLPALNKTGAEIVRGGSVFDRASDIEKASKLREAGIPGIKYLDQGSRAAGEGSRNYVVFDDNLVEILKKYGLVGLLGGGAAMGAANQGQEAPQF